MSSSHRLHRVQHLSLKVGGPAALLCSALLCSCRLQENLLLTDSWRKLKHLSRLLLRTVCQEFIEPRDEGVGVGGNFNYLVSAFRNSSGSSEMLIDGLFFIYSFIGKWLFSFWPSDELASPVVAMSSVTLHLTSGGPGENPAGPGWRRRLSGSLDKTGSSPPPPSPPPPRLPPDTILLHKRSSFT